MEGEQSICLKHSKCSGMPALTIVNRYNYKSKCLLANSTLVSDNLLTLDYVYSFSAGKL